MAGVLLHLAMGDPEKTDPENSHYSSSFKKAYTLGLLLPDIAKRDFIGNEEEFNRFFEGCSRDDILTYEEYLSFQKNHHFNPNRQNPSKAESSEKYRQAFPFFRRLCTCAELVFVEIRCLPSPLCQTQKTLRTFCRPCSSV